MNRSGTEIEERLCLDPKPENETAARLRAAAGCGPLNEGGRRIRHATERTQRRADRIRSAAGRGRQEGERSVPRDGRVGTSILQLETALCWLGLERTAGAATVARREPKAEDAGGRPDSGQAYS